MRQPPPLLLLQVQTEAEAKPLTPRWGSPAFRGAREAPVTQAREGGSFQLLGADLVLPPCGPQAEVPELESI